jgi:AcrR family transcriptional regulator
MLYSMNPPPRTPNIRGKRATGRVVAAATRLFAERGYNGVSIAEVATEAGVTKPAILYHFDKESLWKACVEALWADVDAFFAVGWPQNLPPSRPKLEAILDLFVQCSIRYPAYVRIPFIEGATPSWRSEWLVDKHFRPHVRATDRIIRALQAEHVIGPGDPAHYQALMSSPINVFVAQAAMWDRCYGRRLSGIKALKQQARLALDLIFRSDSV